MRQNPHKSECYDHYCDANNVCGESCAEIDIMEANEHAWHTTLHTAKDHEGFGGGYGGGDGWPGPRDFLSDQYGPGASSIDTKKPFDVVCSFMTDAGGELRELEVVLTQEGGDGPLRISLPEYPGNSELTKALHSGMTPIVSYWKSKEMLWMDGTGDDGKGPCDSDTCECGETVVFGNFSIFDIEEQELPPHEDVPPEEGEVLAAEGSEPEPGGQREPACPGKVDVAGEAAVSVVPAGWKSPVGGEVELDRHAGAVVPHLGGRAYFADDCVPGEYDNEQYTALELLGKRLKFTVDIGGAGCGCVAELRLMPMRFNKNPTACSDFYCDASSLCGESCVEVDVMRANMHAWHSNLRAENDHTGLPVGYGGAEGPREWTKEDYGPGGKCIDTTKKFDVEVSFPVDYNNHLAAMEVLLSQKACNLSLRLANYPREADVSEALRRGLTPVVGYWASGDTLWLDGPGADRRGPCTEDVLRSEGTCADKVAVSGFSVEHVGAPSGELVDGVPEAQEESTRPSLAASASAGGRPTRTASAPSGTRASMACSQPAPRSTWSTGRGAPWTRSTGPAGSTAGLATLTPTWASG
ncbi:unnamed protein product [Prorocentrum cordatum]|uniref:cellulose 1,4-beta-cellobiosidase (non-reducing end) n=1 Tax=Prorocentrum cordatum TaxID=2364126 RepID=A0ABN9TTH5_9DINO|nr:unnamed protein product [Polarella glacialis]